MNEGAFQESQATILQCFPDIGLTLLRIRSFVSSQVKNWRPLFLIFFQTDRHRNQGHDVLSLVQRPTEMLQCVTVNPVRHTWVFYFEIFLCGTGECHSHSHTCSFATSPPLVL